MADAQYDSIEETPLFVKGFTFVDILKYTELLNKTHTIDNNYNAAIINGQRLFSDRFVTDIRHRILHDKDGECGFAVRATVKAEMRKLTSHKVTALILNDNTVTSVACGCPGGATPACCKHGFAVLSAVEDYSRRELFSAPIEKLQTWHQPRAVKVSPKKFNAASDSVTAVPDEQTAQVNLMALSGLHQTMPIFSVVSGTGSGLLSDEIFYDETVALPLNSISSSISPTLPDYLDVDTVCTYHQHVRKPLLELQMLEKETMSQSTPKWHLEREKRITASRVHEVLKTTNPHKLCEQLFTKKDLSHIAPIQLGKRLEPMVKNTLRRDFEDYVFRNTGLVVHPDYPFLGASPDGLLFKEDDCMIVEVKCVFNVKHLSLDELYSQRENFCLHHDTSSNVFSLTHDHKYYYQIQLQLFCTGVDKCLFTLFYDYGKPLFKEVIQKNDAFWNRDMLFSLTQFYFSVYLPKYISINPQ